MKLSISHVAEFKVTTVESLTIDQRERIAHAIIDILKESNDIIDVEPVGICNINNGEFEPIIIRYDKTRNND